MNTEPVIDPKWGKQDPTHDPYVLAHFQARPTDVLITTAAKAGTTWMQQILHQLRTGGDDRFNAIDDVVPWLELPRPDKHWSEVLAEYEALTDPRLFKTHCTYEQAPGINTARFILTSRDPRDCCISFYHHIMDMTDDAKHHFGISEPESFDAFLDDWLDFASWYRNVSSWWPHRNDSNVLWLRYEDLKHDFDSGINKILHFLDWHIDPKQRARITELCSFQWMKENASRFAHQNDAGESIFRPGGFIRKGQVGNGKESLSQEQEQRILDKAREYLSADCLVFFGIESA
jgi:hypothetical protein